MKKRIKLTEKIKSRALQTISNNKGMELVQVAILVAIAIVVGLIFRDEIEAFVNDIFGRLSSGSFS